jgi:hypothetical protein
MAYRTYDFWVSDIIFEVDCAKPKVAVAATTIIDKIIFFMG